MKIEVTAFPRTQQGTGASRRLRASGRVPGRRVRGGQAGCSHRARSQRAAAPPQAGSVSRVDPRHERWTARRTRCCCATSRCIRGSSRCAARGFPARRRRTRRSTCACRCTSVNAEIAPGVKDRRRRGQPRVNPNSTSVPAGRPAGVHRGRPVGIEGNLHDQGARLKLPQGVKAVVKGKENPVVVSVTIPGAVVEEEVAAVPVAAVEVPAQHRRPPRHQPRRVRPRKRAARTTRVETRRRRSRPGAGSAPGRSNPARAPLTGRFSFP